jgi:polysaccharide export outer membrane protein
MAATALLLLGFADAAIAEDNSAPPLRATLDGAGAENAIARTPKSDDLDYRLGPHDKISITVDGDDELSGPFQIDGAGCLVLPLIGEIKAAGSTAPELEGAIAKALDDGYLKDARVSVEVTEYRPFYIMGQINKPGEYAYTSNMSVFDAILRAGGYTEKAADSTLYIRHENEATEHAIVIDPSTRIRPGDVVRVPETALWSLAGMLSPGGN